VEPGQRARLLALARNQSGIVDTYELRVEGLPEGWWSIFPDAVHLVPYGSGGAYEQEVEVHLHPPRTAEAEARDWDLRVTARSRARGEDVVGAPLTLRIEPYQDTSTQVRPERAGGRRRADFDVAVENRANAPVLVALEGTDPDGALRFGFDRPPQEVPAGQTVQTRMRVSPPRQIWLGRPTEHRLQVITLTGADAAGRLAQAPVPADQAAGPAAGAGAGGGLLGRWGSPPRVYRPQVQAPGIDVGPGGLSARAPKLRGPELSGPQLDPVSFDLSSLKGPAPGAVAAGAPVLPSQAVFRQQPWLPWWLAPVAVTLAVLAVALYALLPDNVNVPELAGTPSVFEAEKKLTAAGLTLAAAPRERPSDAFPPGTVIDQDPPADASAQKGSEVTIEVAVGSGRATVPKITGLTLAAAEKRLRASKLSLGQASPQPPDPEGKISSQIPEAGEVVEEGSPVAIFFPDPADPAGGGEKAKDKEDGPGEGGGDDNGGTDGGGGGGEVLVPAIGKLATDAYAQKVAAEGLVPETEKRYNAAPPGTLFATEPAGGETRKAGDKLKLLVSAGFPKLAFDDDKDVLLVDGSTGKPLDPIAEGSQHERDPTYSPDGVRVAYQSEGRVFVVEPGAQEDAPAPLTPEGDHYSDLAWAPSTERDVLAMIKKDAGGARLCFGRVTSQRIRTRCAEKPPDGISLDRKINWAPDGREVLVFGVTQEKSTFGMVRYRSPKAFSADGARWRTSGYVTDVSKPGRGVLDASFAPDGKTMAIAANLKTKDFRLFTAKADDVLLTKAEPLGVRACKVVWRPDGKELVVVQADDCTGSDTGELVRLPVDDPKQQQQLRLGGDNPTFQPLTIEG